MNSNYIIIGVIVLVLLGGGLWLTRPKSLENNSPAMTQQAPTQPPVSNVGDTPQPNQKMDDSVVVPKAEQNMVNYTDKGFEPQALTIKVGTTVTFTNMSETKMMWVASAPHPTHTDYPEFDQKKAVGKEEVFSFTFNKAGTWKYHNHTDPASFGSITVQ